MVNSSPLCCFTYLFRPPLYTGCNLRVVAATDATHLSSVDARTIQSHQKYYLLSCVHLRAPSIHGTAMTGYMPVSNMRSYALTTSEHQNTDTNSSCGLLDVQKGDSSCGHPAISTVVWLAACTITHPVCNTIAHVVRKHWFITPEPRYRKSSWLSNSAAQGCRAATAL